jgi:hypothetical protein
LVRSNLLDKALKSKYLELFKDGLSEGEGVGVGIHFQQKMICDCALKSAVADTYSVKKTW